MNLIKEYAKTFSAFAAGVVLNAIVQLIQGEVPWPTTGAEWLQFVLTSFGVAGVVAGTRNKITQKQLDKDPNVVGGTVVDNPPTGTYSNPWQ